VRSLAMSKRRFRLALGLVCEESIFAAASQLPGHKRSHEARCLPPLNALKSEPSSAQRFCTVIALMPGTVVRSTPQCAGDQLAGYVGCGPQFRLKLGECPGQMNGRFQRREPP
jgi:hypothetical protein